MASPQRTPRLCDRFRHGINSCLAPFVLITALLQAGSSLRAEVVISEIYYQPTSQNPAEEWIEIQNTGAEPVNLAGWRFSSGVHFEFPAHLLPAGGFVVVCANANLFKTAFPNVPALGNWLGALSDSGERIELRNASDQVADSVAYATEGDWAQRWRVRNGSFPGWTWAALHKGLGNSLERISPTADGNLGQNWLSSDRAPGTPGLPNIASRLAPAPFILKVQHSPAVPQPTDPVVVSAEIRLDSGALTRAVVVYRVDGTDISSEVPLLDDGKHNDGLAGDGRYAAVLPPQPNGTIVDFYIVAEGNLGNRRWPDVTYGEAGATANCLYQVDTEAPGLLPRYRLVMTAAQNQLLHQIEAQPWYLPSDAQVNATFICVENGVAEVRYRCGVRQRGTTSRDLDPPSRRVNFPNDHPWRGWTAINLNGVRPHSQVVGSALARLAGLPAARARLVEVRENGLARSGPVSPVPGLYAHNEELDAAYLEAAFPNDPGGNLYSTSSFADLAYLGEASSPYAAQYYYTKESNRSINDWSDLIGLTRTLTQSSPADFEPAVRAVADTREWAAYFACNYLLGNVESSLAFPTFRADVWNTGDYFLYRGERDTRFRLIPYDFDSVLGTEGGDLPNPYVAANVASIGRFLGEPAFGAEFHSALLELSQTVLSPASIHTVIDRLLQPHVPAAYVDAMKAFAARRPSILQAVLPSTLSLTNTQSTLNGAVVVSAQSFRLGGIANPGVVSALRLNANAIPIHPIGGTWSTNVALRPGMNRLHIQAIGADGTEVTNLVYNVWRDTPAGLNTSGTLLKDTVWKASQSPIVVLDDIHVPSGVSLTIEPGTTVSLAKDKQILVEGRLVAAGTPENRIYIGVAPIYKATWNGIRFLSTTEANALLYVDLAQSAPSPLFLTNSVATFEGLDFLQHNGNALLAYYSSLTVRNSRFPDITFGEPVGVLGARAGGRVLFEGNHFGTTVGYADIIEASLLKRPGPILEIIGNTFEGGGDDGLDLDGCDAYIEGNTFRHFHKDVFNQNTSISSAIAVGQYTHGETSDLVVLRNFFVGNDYDFEFKEYATLDIRNNTFINGLHGSVAFSEPLRPGNAPGKSATFNGCIWSGYDTPFAHLNPASITSGTIAVTVDNSLLPQTGPWGGTNTVPSSPHFVDANADWHLKPESPARNRVGPGIDAGAWIPAGPIVLNPPEPVSDAKSYILKIEGVGLTHYRFTYDGSGFSTPRTIETLLELHALKNGVHQLQVYGYGLNQRWQTLPGTTLDWEIVAAAPRVRLNEVLARNPTNVLHGGIFSDLIELRNAGTVAADLSDMSLTDEAALPRKFVFPAGTQIAPGGFLVIHAGSTVVPGFLNTGFGLNGDGDGVFLFDRSTQNNALLDAVRFGPQLVGKSIGRNNALSWVLCNPTFGSTNEPAVVGNPTALRLNEFLAKDGPLSSGEFIELANPLPVPIALDQLSLTESLAVPNQHLLPSLGFIEANGFLSLEQDAAGNALSLSSEFGSLGLFDGVGQLIDSVVYANQGVDLSEGRIPDITGPFSPLPRGPSPGAANQPPVEAPLVLHLDRPAGGLITVSILGTVPNRTYALEACSALGLPFQTLGLKSASTTTTAFSVTSPDEQLFLRVRQVD